MSKAAEFLQQAKATRDHAAHARRLVSGFSLQADKNRLSRYADELDEQARTLELEAATFEGHQTPPARPTLRKP